MKSRTGAGNRWYYSLRQTFRSRVMSKAIKIQIYKTTDNQL